MKLMIFILLFLSSFIYFGSIQRQKERKKLKKHPIHIVSALDPFVTLDPSIMGTKGDEKKYVMNVLLFSL
jgi:hypothetical protein